jgi:hypothetical protein
MKLALALVLALAACRGKGTSAPTTPIVVVPPRVATVGDDLLARLPADAAILVELDLKRLRGNAAVGELATALLADPGAANVPGVPAGPLARADVVVLASYRVGTAEAITIGVVRGGGLTAADFTGGLDLGDGVVAVAPPELAPEILAASTGAAPSLAGDEALRALRARGMPEKAEGATLRITARLDFDARVQLASQLGIDAAPAHLSLWGDVADDLAIVAVMDAPDKGGGAVGDKVGEEMARAVRGWLDTLARTREVAALGLAAPLREVRIRPRGEGVSIVALVGPRRLARAVGRARTFLGIANEIEGEHR